MSARWLRLALLVHIVALAAGAADEKPLTARQRLESALKTTRELFHDSTPDKRFSAHEEHLFPRQSHVQTYFLAGRWEAEATMFFGALETPAYWPTAADAAQLRELLRDKDPQYKALAASALASLHQPDDVPHIAELLTDQRLAAPRLERALLSLPLRPHQNGQADEVDCSLWWQQRTVREYAQEALRRMTGISFTPDSFAPWWARNKIARERLWYWQGRFERKMASAEKAARRALERRRDERGRHGPDILAADTQDDYAAYQRDLKERCAKARQEIAAELARLPAELEAKIRLCADGNGGSELAEDPEKFFFAGPPKLRLDTERLLELLAGRNLWPDVDWEQGNYNRLVVRLSLAAGTTFQARHVGAFKEVHQTPRFELWWDGRAAPSVAIGRMLHDPAMRADWLRDCIRNERDLFARGYVAAELVNVGLPRHREFLMEAFFAEQEKNAIPDLRMSVLRALGQPPLTQNKREALIELVLDKRFEILWTQAGGRMGTDAYRHDASRSLNAHAGRELISYDDQLALADPSRSAKALGNVLTKVRSLTKQ
jgi:hypothetical protein